MFHVKLLWTFPLLKLHTEWVDFERDICILKHTYLLSGRKRCVGLLFTPPTCTLHKAHKLVVHAVLDTIIIIIMQLNLHNKCECLCM